MNEDDCEPELDELDEEFEVEYGELDDDELDMDFAMPGGNSALRAATASNPRVHPCPTCERPNRLTARDVELGYQCDRCADACERGI